MVVCTRTDHKRNPLHLQKQPLLKRKITILLPKAVTRQLKAEYFNLYFKWTHVHFTIGLTSK